MIEPDEIYNLAAQSHVMVSFKNPVYTSQTGTLGTLSLLEAVKTLQKNQILPSFIIRNVWWRIKR